MQWLTYILEAIEVFFRRSAREAREQENGSAEPKEGRPLSFENIKDAALDALEDSGAKDEVVGILKSNKDLFVDEAKGYLKAIVSTFKGDQYDPEKYAEMIAIMDDEQLVAEVQATAAEIAGIRATVDAKKKFCEDLKTVASAVARKAIVAGLSAYVGPAAGPIANFLIPGGA